MFFRGPLQVIKTYRYLRLSMVLLSVLLAVSVIYESIRSSTILGSVSAYYYTPAKAVFVGALVAIGIGLVALRGNTEPEDVFLNLAGMFAPVVAFVPTPRGAPSDSTVLAIENNVWSFLIVGFIAIVVAAIVAKWGQRPPDDGTSLVSEWKLADKVGLAIALAIVVAGGCWLALWHDGFIAYAHYSAAIAMFAFIALAVLVNTKPGAERVALIADHFSKSATRVERWNPQRDGGKHFGRLYGSIFVLMLATQLLWFLKPIWDQTILAVEASMIVLFAVFWSLQTWDLRNTDLESDPIA